MKTNSLIRFINLLLASLLAGTSFGIWMGLNPVNYSPATYLEQQQNLVQSLNTLMVAMVVIATLVTLISAYVERQNKQVLIALLAAAVFFAVCIFVSKFGNLPIQTEMLTWKPDAMPENWTELRDQWWSLHIIRTASELISLLLLAWVNVFNPSTK